ncbi:MAG: response regulator [Myxococcaceae bacterium]|nr:response regulator [Myxococcaceae bacterium]
METGAFQAKVGGLMPSLKRVLFVDDEPNVLKGLQTMFRPLRNTWEMVFVEGGAAALAELKRGRFDVVVSDMRMPNVDGAAVLNQAALLWPTAGRILFTGFADPDALERLTASYVKIDKPCPSAVLRDAIEKAMPAVP